jgi:HAD superfamily hydrolase (TIGR01509 family)
MSAAHPGRAGGVHRALLIDFGGTLFLPLDGKRWLAAAAPAASAALSAGEHGRLAALLDKQLGYAAEPGSDLSPAAHRRSVLPALESLVADQALAAALYAVQTADEFWRPRNGARELLSRARELDLRVVVVSNIPWDIRPLFTAAGMRDQVHEFVLSCEVGTEKPAKQIFERALELVGCTPAQAVFIGDDRVADSGALDTGMPVILVPRTADNADRSLFGVTHWLTGPAVA